MQSPAFLEIRRVSKTYHSAAKSSEVLKEVSFDVARGEFLVLVGPSGCGKSTILNMIAGFETPTTGEILLEGRKVTGAGPDRLMMFQEHALFPWLNVIDNIAFGLREKRMSREERRARAEELVRMVHLEGWEKAWIHELSGGMRHRVALARSIAPDPAILLIDEPFSSLDAVTKQHLYAELQEIWSTTGKTIISVTHDPAEAACLGDRVVVFSTKPGELKSQILIDIARPRSVNDYRVGQYARAITEHLEK